MIDWNAVDTVLLDMDGTLLDLHFDNYFFLEYVPQKYAEKHAITLEQGKEEILQRYKQVSGKLQWYCLDYWQKELNLDLLTMKREVANLISFRPNAELFLQNLKERGKEVVMITNAHRDSLSLKLERLSMAHYFDKLISSHDYGYPKEEQAFWYSLEAAIGMDKTRALFIDDNTAILDSAKEFGIGHLLTIRYPDSKKGAIDPEGYEAISDFRDLVEA